MIQGVSQPNIDKLDELVFGASNGDGNEAEGGFELESSVNSSGFNELLLLLNSFEFIIIPL